MSAPPVPTFEQRVAMHAALAEPHRLAICDALALSDRSPSELAALLGVGTNLLAHHLQVLTEAGLVETVTSAGDRRRRYVRLRPGAAEVAAPPPLAPASVLFVCTHNSARSQFAAALWRRASGIPVDSAGTHPAARVHPGAARTAARHGVDLRDAVPHAIEDGAPPGLVVTVCDEANEELTLTGRAGRLHWSIPDPVRAGTPRAFDEAFAAVASRVEALAEAVGA
ncbi:MAG: helix-turn-helix domain-containing protein [Dehalococcoidia bacterium]